MSKENKKEKKFTNHHILPSSRGGNDSEQNIQILKKEKHRKYHDLFINMTPDEIIRELVDNYWNGQSQWVSIYLNELEGVS